VTHSPYPSTGPAAYPPPSADGSPYAAYPSVGYAPAQMPAGMVVRTNTLAVVAFITGLFGMAVVPVVLGHISMPIIRRTGERGYVLAVIALVLGYLEVAWLVAVMILAVLASMS